MMTFLNIVCVATSLGGMVLGAYSRNSQGTIWSAVALIASLRLLEAQWGA